VKPAAGYQSLACSSPEAVQTTGTVAASGNIAEAQTKLEEARSSWKEVSPAISAREAREAELLFDSLEIQLKSRAPAVELNSTVYSMLEKLSEDIAGELR
jgi:hypothetical protein